MSTYWNAKGSMTSSEPGLVEMAGLPGVGKTTAARELLEELPHSRISFFATHKRKLRTLRLIWLFAPYALLRFRSVFAQLGSLEPPVRRSILYLLNVFLAELCLATLEAKLRGRALILDEGFVQRGIGLCLRAPETIRSELWQSYLECIPDGLVCLVLAIDPDHAFARAQSRRQGVPEVFQGQDAAETSPEGEAQKPYAETSAWLASDALRTRVRCIDVSAEGESEALVGRIASELGNLWPAKRRDTALLFVREAEELD